MDNDLDLYPRFRCRFGVVKDAAEEVNYVSLQQTVRFQSTSLKTCFKKIHMRANCFGKVLFESICYPEHRCNDP